MKTEGIVSVLKVTLSSRTPQEYIELSNANVSRLNFRCRVEWRINNRYPADEFRSIEGGSHTVLPLCELHSQIQGVCQCVKDLCVACKFLCYVDIINSSLEQKLNLLFVFSVEFLLLNF